MIRKRSITIRGHRTSLSMEDRFWDALQEIASLRRIPIASLVAEIDAQREPEDNLSSAARLYCLDWFRTAQRP